MELTHSTPVAEFSHADNLGAAVAALASPFPALFIIEKAEGRAWQALREGRADGSGTLGNNLFVLVGDDFDEVELRGVEHLIDHDELTLTQDELRLLGVEMESLVDDTGGVGALVAAALDGRAALLGAAQRWALRYDRFLVDPVAALLPFTGRALEGTVVQLACGVLGRTVEAEEVRLARQSTAVIRPRRGEPFIPEALANALLARLKRDEPVRFRHIRHHLVRLARSNESIPAPERMRLLTAGQEFQALDDLLAEKLHALIGLTPEGKRWFVGRWPSPVPRYLPHLALAHRYLVDDWRTEPAPPGVPEEWLALSMLLSQDRQGRTGFLREKARTWFEGFMDQGWSAELAAASVAVERGSARILAYSARLDRAQVLAKPDDAALLVGLLTSATDAALMVASSRYARLLVAEAERLCSSLGAAAKAWPAMWPGVAARGSVVAAHFGLVTVARGWLEEFARVVPDSKPLDRCLAATAEHFVVDDPADAVHPPGWVINPEAWFAPIQAEAVAMRIALSEGQSAATKWAKAMLNRASWTRRAWWEWWPLVATLGLLEAAAGRPGEARAALEQGSLPPALDLIVGASVELSDGRSASALRMSRQALTIPDLPVRWRMTVSGIKLACLAADPSQGNVEELLRQDGWSEMPAVVAMLPAESRALLSPLWPDTQLPGLRPDAEPELEVIVDITPRQRQVLGDLSRGKTMPEIAADYTVSVETVRSTAKSLYRRLGVHDRDAAVTVGRALGLLPE